jgi:hypothetical protein
MTFCFRGPSTSKPQDRFAIQKLDIYYSSILDFVKKALDLFTETQ